jgi:phage host-nuclease inhibitor protein Gam
LAEKSELIITALQQRIGEITASYETQIAFLRAEITVMMEEKENREKAVQEYTDHLDNLAN